MTELNFDFEVAAQKKTNVIMYTCKIKNNVLMESVLEQDTRVKRFIKIFTEWSLEKIYNDGKTDIENPTERKEFSKLLNDIESGKFNGYKLIIYTSLLLFSPNFNVTNFVDDLHKRKMSLVIADVLADTSDKYGLLAQQINSGIAKYRDWCNSVIYIVFSGIKSINDFPSKNYRDSVFANDFFEDNLKNIIQTECKGDNWLEIILLKNMERVAFFECKENETLDMNIEKILQLV